jgi:hypothetical protein
VNRERKAMTVQVSSLVVFALVAGMVWFGLNRSIVHETKDSHCVARLHQKPWLGQFTIEFRDGRMVKCGRCNKDQIAEMVRNDPSCQRRP